MRAENLITAIILTSLLVQGSQDVEDFIEDDSLSTRILNGQQANVHNFPFLVTLFFGEILCGGTIIANEWVMSAAHCVFEMNCYTARIIPAVWENRNGINPIRCIVHPQYVRGWFAYDVSLLQVQPGYFNNGLTRPINLPNPGTYYPAGTPAVIVGWGQMENANYPRVLLWANVNVEDWDRCNAQFMRNDYACMVDPNCNTNMPNRVLCTQGYGYSPPGTCFGDSGGPVVIDNTVAGIVSFVLKDGDYCKIGAPSMHVSVVDYIPWLMSIVAPQMDMSGVQVRPEHY